MTARVLVVDDQPLNIKVLEAKLASEYYEVVTASDGPSALAALQESHPDIVLLDIMMPGMNGFEVCERMKADRKLAHIPVIMVTALSESEDRVRGLEAGADDFLTKPINDVALFARLRSLLRLKMALDELRLRDHTSLQLGVLDDRQFNVSKGTGARVMVAEDLERDARLITDELSRENIVTCFGSPGAALESAKSGNYDLIIVSLDLAGSDGLRLCSQLRSREETRHVPLLMLLEEGDVSRLTKGFDLGVSDYLYKPIDRNELLARARSQIRHKYYQDRLRNTYQRSVSLAVTDSLTGLYNRLYLTSYLASLIDRHRTGGKPLSAAMLDIDHFKGVNDGYGHDVGDGVLRELADRLNRFVRASDLVARLGGEEFVVVMPDTDVATAEAVTGRLRCEIAGAPFVSEMIEGGLQITVSIGVAGLLDGGDTTEALLKRADEALYEAKRGGRNRVIAAAV
ncbi:MAG: PleD family two-component system response regulator [Alphaproteobacteria bacterium]